MIKENVEDIKNKLAQEKNLIIHMVDNIDLLKWAVLARKVQED